MTASKAGVVRVRDRFFTGAGGGRVAGVAKARKADNSRDGENVRPGAGSAEEKRRGDGAGGDGRSQAHGEGGQGVVGRRPPGAGQRPSHRHASAPLPRRLGEKGDRGDEGERGEEHGLGEDRRHLAVAGPPEGGGGGEGEQS